MYRFGNWHKKGPNYPKGTPVKKPVHYLIIWSLIYSLATPAWAAPVPMQQEQAKQTSPMQSFFSCPRSLGAGAAILLVVQTLGGYAAYATYLAGQDEGTGYFDGLLDKVRSLPFAEMQSLLETLPTVQTLLDAINAENYLGALQIINGPNFETFGNAVASEALKNQNILGLENDIEIVNGMVTPMWGTLLGVSIATILLLGTYDVCNHYYTSPNVVPAPSANPDITQLEP